MLANALTNFNKQYYVIDGSIVCSPRLYVFDQKYSKNYYNLK